MTKRENFATLRAMVETSTVENKVDMINFIDHEVELLDRKSAKSGQTKTQKENVVIKEQIVSAMREIGTPSTATEIMNAMGMTSINKVVALLSQLVKAGKVVRTEDKKKAYFSVAE